jgi:acetolactate synthase-1/2/3 large subunit
MNFPTRHPLYGGGPQISEADVVLVVEATIPWQPGYAEPSPGSRIVHLGLDPVASRHLYYEFEADLRITAEPAAALQQLYQEAERLLTTRHRQRIAERQERVAAASRAIHERAERDALAQAGHAQITPAYLSYMLGQVLPDGAILLDEAVTNTPHVIRHVPTSHPGTFFHSGATAGGWGPAAAFGAKLARPDRLVALTIGDGFFLYGVPYAGLWSAAKYGAPFLTVVYQNHAYSTGTTSVAHYYPDGFAAREGDYEGGVIEPAPDLAKLAESVGAYGENVSAADELRPALERGIRLVEQGTPAVIAVHLPSLGPARNMDA